MLHAKHYLNRPKFDRVFRK